MRKRLIPALLACLLLLSACGGIPEMDAADIARGAADTERLREGRL